MPRLRSALVALPFLVAGSAAVGQPLPRGPEGDAWLKVAGLASGAATPVVLSDAEVNALLATERVSSWLTEHLGLAHLQIGLHPGRAHFTGALAAARLPALVPLALEAGSGDAPVDATIRFGGDGGLARGEIVRGSVSGMELPPQLLEEILADLIAGLFPSPEKAEEAIRAGASFALPYGLERVEIASGELRLHPAPPRR